MEAVKHPMFAYAHCAAGDRGWEIFLIESRERLCADMREGDAKALCEFLNYIGDINKKWDVPGEQIAAIYRMIKDNPPGT